MKADRCGTWTEQLMFRQGYLTSKERQAAGRFGEKCDNCELLIRAPLNQSSRCALGKFIVTINATCDKWIGRKP